MKTISILLAASMTAGMLGAMPVLADPGKGKGNGHKFKHAQRGAAVKHRGTARYVADCPPGLAKKNPPCVPPGQAKKHVARYGTGIGDILRVGDFIRVVDYDRYDIQRRSGWDYYRDDNRLYRVDSGTRKVLAVLNLIEAFSR